ncbi:unnamed protein product [Cuscuta campestris]|uniref:Uncharacterized protein n=1 Tax=Cuscuta campestris TaxID=132261 RepID=A0A484KXT8_9ASTE|nr:unnamed protein product [Cuscuta campestris]
MSSGVDSPQVPLSIRPTGLSLFLFCSFFLSDLQPLMFLEIERPKLFNHCPTDFVAGRSGNRGGPSRTRGNGFCLLSSDRPWNGVLVIRIRNVEGRDLIGRTDSLVDLNLDVDGGSFPERSTVGIVELLPLRGTTQNTPKIDGHLALVPVVLISGRGKLENIAIVRAAPPGPGAFLVNSDKLSDFFVDVALFGSELVPGSLQPLLFLEIEHPKLFNHCPADFVTGRSGNRGGPSRTRGNGFCLLSSDRPWNGVLVIGIRNVEGRDLMGRTDSLVDLNLGIDGGSFPERSSVGIVELLPLWGTLKILQRSMGTLPWCSSS